MTDSRRQLVAIAAMLLACVVLSDARVLNQVSLRSSSCPELIREGQTGQCVTTLQSLLKDKGFSPGTVDGDFGPNTLSAVKSFQSSAGLEVDGVVGPNTKDALYSSGSNGGGSGGSTGSGDLAAVLDACRKEVDAGVPYVWGGGHQATPGRSTGTCDGYTGDVQPCPAETTVGFDCSGLTRWCYYKAFGSDVLTGDATGGQEARLRDAGKATDNPVPGDVLFWKDPASHTAIFSGNGKMIETDATGTPAHETDVEPGFRAYHF